MELNQLLQFVQDITPDSETKRKVLNHLLDNEDKLILVQELLTKK